MFGIFRLSISFEVVSPVAPGTAVEAAPMVLAAPTLPKRAVPTVRSAISSTVSWAVRSSKEAFPAITSSRVTASVLSVVRRSGAPL